MSRPKLLIAEETEACRQTIRAKAARLGFEVFESQDRVSTLKKIAAHHFDMVMVGSLEGSIWQSLEIARKIPDRPTKFPLILVPKDSSEDLAVAALRAGFTDYCKYPLGLDELSEAMQRFLEVRRVGPRNSGDVATRRLIEDEPMVGSSQTMVTVKAQIGNAAMTGSNVLITGETGTGKELAARLIHRNSRRHTKPLVCMNCAAIPESLLESELFGYERGAFTGAESLRMGKLKMAGGGTIFLDEIGDMSSHAQAKILRAIETKEVQPLGGKCSVAVDMRVIAATNQDLEQLLAEGKFRKDLYFRLNVIRIHLPPLRSRKEDLLPLIEHYIQDFNGQFGRAVEGLTEKALEYLFSYEWPGNVRELKNLLEAIFVNLSSEEIAFVDLPEQFRRQLKHSPGSMPPERDRLLSALLATNWNKSKAAEKLHWSRMTLYRKMAKYQIGSSSKPPQIKVASSGSG